MHHLKKVDFFWINRDQKSFEWFLTLLNQMETEQAQEELTVSEGKGKRFMDIHMYFTQALQKTDMRAVGLQVALDLLYKKVCLKGSKIISMLSFLFLFLLRLTIRPFLGLESSKEPFQCKMGSFTTKNAIK